MDLHEEIVLAYLTKDPYTFVSPQYSIRIHGGGEWACPDFIALNFRTRTASIVEVSTAWNPKDLREKVLNRDTQWIEKLRDQLQRYNVIDDTWQLQVQLFIRKSATTEFKRLFGNVSSVSITVLEDLGLPWEWQRSYE